MSSAEGKFVIKHVFSGPWDTKISSFIYSNKEIHFNVPWKIRIYKSAVDAVVRLECLKFCGSKEWSIDAEINVKVLKKTGEESAYRKYVFTQKTDTVNLKALKIIKKEKMENYLIDGNFTIELHVKVNKMTGVRIGKLRSFDDESAKEFSDVVLSVKNEKFYLLKMYLASHSSYFKSLLLGNFSESKKSEIELRDIDPHDFQNFLELVHGESDVDEDTFEGVLYLADMYDSKTAIRKCEEFLIGKSERSLKIKFNLANKYKLDKLKEKCMSEIKTADDIRTLVPHDSNNLVAIMLRQLLDKSLQLLDEK